MTAALTLSAQAATGQLTLTRDDGSVSVISNPRDGRCYSLRGAGAARVANDTDSTAFVYMDSGCSGLVSRVDAGETWEKSGTQAADSIVLFQP
ncbi:hypothetical protein ABZY02_31585 [Streptomyces sp. NPDC006649]|uniref:hypothetical protein n=1 Tax=Streptomyces sp. NPDC006649 TaxID=3156896 RepID=UPI0033A74DCF